MKDGKDPSQAVREVMEKFQEGYQKRKLDRLADHNREANPN